VAIYKRIDQEELEKLGLGHKSEIGTDSGSLKSVFEYSMLQRFRQNKNFRQIDKYKPKAATKEELLEIKEREHDWWNQNAVTKQQKIVEQKQVVEKGRYI